MKKIIIIKEVVDVSGKSPKRYELGKVIKIKNTKADDFVKNGFAKFQTENVDTVNTSRKLKENKKSFWKWKINNKKTNWTKTAAIWTIITALITLITFLLRKF